VLRVNPVVLILMTILGLVLGSVTVYLSPRLAAHRLDEPPTLPGMKVLVPIAGAWLASWRQLRTIGTEVVAAVAFAGLYLHFGWERQLLLACAFTTLLLTIAYIDVDYRLVLNRLSYPGMLAAFGASLLWPRMGITSAVLGALTGLSVFFVLQLIGRGKLGTGDTKLAILIGAIRGFPDVFNALLLGVLLGALAGIILMVVMRRGRKTYFAYAPYLAAGAVLSFFV
jgi:prepilin signal peptidase PulO-like enzyme (type II secretory pathway)